MALRETELSLGVLALSESVFALGNGHIRLQANIDEGEPNGLPGSYLNRLYEPRLMPYAEAGYGDPTAGQTAVNSFRPLSRHRAGDRPAGHAADGHVDRERDRRRMTRGRRSIAVAALEVGVANQRRAAVARTGDRTRRAPDSGDRKWPIRVQLDRAAHPERAAAITGPHGAAEPVQSGGRAVRVDRERGPGDRRPGVGAASAIGAIRNIAGEYVREPQRVSSAVA